MEIICIKNYTYADVLNERNIIDLEKVGIVIELSSPNYSMYKFQKVNIFLSNGSTTVTNALVNQRLSGEWIISDINFVVKRGEFKQEMVLLRRELQLSEEEMKMLESNQISDTFTNRTKFRNPSSGRNTDVGDYGTYEDYGPMLPDEPVEPLPGGELITAEQLKQIFGYTTSHINQFIVALNNELKLNGFNTVYRIAHAIAQIHVESKFRPIQRKFKLLISI